MAIVIHEMFDSRTWNPAKDRESGVLEYVLYGTDDDAAARAAFKAEFPATVTFDVNPLAFLDARVWTLGGLFWRATANYGPDTAPLYPAVGLVGPSPTPIPTVPGANTRLGPNFSFDFTGITEKITQSKATISATKRGGGLAPDCNGAIGVTSDGQVQGCDRISPNMEWSVTVTFESVTLAYIDSVKMLVGTTNNATFYTKPAGSQVFMGGNCQTDDTLRAKVTFKFLDRPNLLSIPICEGLVVPAKLGSEYLWVSYKNATSNNRMVQQPNAAYVERICDLADWTNLGIGA